MEFDRGEVQENDIKCLTEGKWKSLKIGGSGFMTRRTSFRLFRALLFLYTAITICIPEQSRSALLAIGSVFSKIGSLDSNARERNFNSKSRLSPSGWPLKEVDINETEE